MKKLTLPLTFVIVLAGCVSSDESVTPVPPASATFKALFVPAGGVFPFPNDLFFSGQTDGTLNIPVQDPTDVSDYLVAMNAQDGWSTTAPFFVPFNGDIDGASITAASVKVVNVTGAPAPLGFGTAFSASVSPAADGTNQLMITPLVPLNPKSRYAVIISRGITSGGTAAVADATMQAMLDVHTAGAPVPPELVPLYTTAGLGNVITLANGLGVPDANIAVVFTVSTQSTTDVMTFVNTNAVAGAVLGSTIVGPTNLLGPLPGYATVYQGVISVPYYQSKTAPMTSHWHTATGAEVTRYTVGGGAGPAATQTLNIPILMSLPNATSPGYGAGKPGTGWPVIIFQHGITGNRSNMIGMADAAAAVGFAVVAIDQPLHGLGSGPLRIVGSERTFDLDVSNNTTGAAGADGTIDGSGQNYINLSSLLTSRDNLRQSAADLIRVVKTIPTIEVDGTANGTDLDSARVHFVGHSLGAIVGTVFLGVNTNVQAATLAMPGGTIARLLRDSPTFAPRINAGLAANGVAAGTQLYEAFLQAAQTAVDSGDPINFAAAANANHLIHLIQVVGDGSNTAGHMPDQVVPNSATARLIAALGLTKKSANGANAEGFVNFTAGDHSSILSTAASAAATGEMQAQMRSFMFTNGAGFTITTASGVIEP